MIRNSVILLLFLLIHLSSSLAFGEINFITDKSLYHKDDQLNISGSVSYDPLALGASMLILNPEQSDIVTIDFDDVDSDGNFSFNIHVGGGQWLSDGTYLIKVTYNDESKEKSIEYTEFSTTIPQPIPEPIPESNPKLIPEPTPVSPPKSSFTTLKLQIPNLLSLEKSPQHYVDRYNNESSYKSWFDTQFPNTSIYNILGYKDPIPLPPELKFDAELWATGKITDSEFVTGIEFMLENNIIMISNIPSGDVSGDEIPDWVRNNAHWWSQDLISENEFVNSLEFLIQEGIIIIN